MGFLGGVPANMDTGAEGMAHVHSDLKGLISNVGNSLRVVAGASEGFVPEAATAASTGFPRTAGNLATDVDYLGQALKAMAKNLRKTMGGE
jgi:hypothetical protein